MNWEIRCGNVMDKLREMPNESIHCIVTSPPYWGLRDYGSPFPEAHFATFPPKLVEPCILAGCPSDGIVLDPFAGAGTTGMVAARLLRSFIGIELNPVYVEMAQRRICEDAPLLNRPSGAVL